MLLPLLCHVVPLNNEICRLTMPVVKGHCAHDMLPHTFNIGMFKSFKKNSVLDVNLIIRVPVYYCLTHNAAKSAATTVLTIELLYHPC